MSLTITINNINDLTDTERAVLRLITSRSTDASDAAWLDNHFDPPEPVLPAIRAGAPVTEPTVRQPAPAPAPAPASADLDANGLPWDKRIHSSSRAKVADGTWRYARNLDKTLIATVEAELRAVQAIPAPIAPIVPPVYTEVDVIAAAMSNPIVTEEPLPPVPPAPIVPLPPAPPAPPSNLPTTFAQLMQYVTPLLMSGKLTQPMLQGVIEALGIPHLAYLGGRPDLVDTVKAAIDAEVSRVTV